MNKPTLKSLTDMGNDENNLSDIHEKALQLMEHGADISDEQLDQLRADERLREACLDLQAATMAFREDHDDTDVDDELSRVHSRLESRAAERPLRRWWAAAAPGLTGTNPFSITTGQIVEPLWANTILQTLGQPLLTGLKGNYQWPVVEAFEATINDEGVALGDSKIPLSKLIARPERVGIAVPITRETINETDGLIETVATEYIPKSVAALINKVEFSTTKLKKYENGKETANDATNLVGPFVGAKTATTYTGDAPALKDILALKSAVLSKNIMPEGLAYVMTETTKGLLEATPKWQGSNQAIVDENGKINGVPVFTTSYAQEGAVYFGAFKYAPMGLFGDMNIIVDPYSQARKNAIDFVLNVDFAITVLRQEAFAILTKKIGG